MTTSSPNPATRYEDNTDQEAQLGLRSTYWAECGHGHPDQRPCPPWCWVAQSDGEFEHTVHPDAPMAALHTIESIHVVASLYEGDRTPTTNNVIETASMLVGLEQLGAGEPMVKVAVRHFVPGKRTHRMIVRIDRALDLTVTDARELITALGHVVALAEGAE